MIAEHGSAEAWQRAMTFEWMARLAEASRHARHILFEGQTRFRLVAEAAAAAGLSHHVPILVDCDDETPKHRLSFDRGQPELADQTMMDWARFCAMRLEPAATTSSIRAQALATSVEAVSRFFD